MMFSARMLLACLVLITGLLTSLRAAEDTLGPGDSIRITVFQNPNLTTETRISPRGVIWFPLIGDVVLGGLSQNEAVSLIADSLRKGQFLNDPQVSINVLQARSQLVSVLGQVVRPGRYPLDEGSSRLTDILALAGGITPDGDNVVSVVSRQGGAATRREIPLAGLYRDSSPAVNLELQAGDTIVVERAPVFYIYGQVIRGGAYRLSEQLNVMQAISLAGGMAPFGTERGIRIHRPNGRGGFDERVVGLSEIIRANDVVRIPESLF